MTEQERKIAGLALGDGTEFICLTFCDVLGNPRNVTLVPEELEKAFDSGISLDASEITGFHTDEKIDLLIRPDASTYAMLPESLTHQDQHIIRRMFCHVYYPDGRRFENDGRYILEQAVEKAKNKGYTFNVGPSMEFYLLQERAAELIPYDNAGYMSCFPDDRCEEIRRELMKALEQMNIRPECAYHEAGPGQNKIKFHFSDPVSAADAVIAYKGVVRTIAADHGLIADFSPRPLEKIQGNSMHVNMSVNTEDGQDRTPHIIAGVLNKIPDITLFLNPQKRSYRRLGHNNAPRYISWSDGNRSTLIRIPAYSGYTRFELRSPDCLANPYLAFALLIEACLYGIEEQPTLMKSTDVDLFTADAKNMPKLKPLPLSLAEAQANARKSAFVASILPQSVIEAFMV